MEDIIEYCPYCHHGFTSADLEEEFCENGDFEAEEEVECPKCEKYFAVYRTFVAYYEICSEMEEE